MAPVSFPSLPPEVFPPRTCRGLGDSYRSLMLDRILGAATRLPLYEQAGVLRLMGLCMACPFKQLQHQYQAIEGGRK